MHHDCTGREELHFQEQKLSSSVEKDTRVMDKLTDKCSLGGGNTGSRHSLLFKFSAHLIVHELNTDIYF